MGPLWRHRPATGQHCLLARTRTCSLPWAPFPHSLSELLLLLQHLLATLKPDTAAQWVRPAGQNRKHLESNLHTFRFGETEGRESWKQNCRGLGVILGPGDGHQLGSHHLGCAGWHRDGRCHIGTSTFNFPRCSELSALKTSKPAIRGIDRAQRQQGRYGQCYGVAHLPMMSSSMTRFPPQV